MAADRSGLPVLVDVHEANSQTGHLPTVTQRLHVRVCRGCSAGEDVFGDNNWCLRQIVKCHFELLSSFDTLKIADSQGADARVELDFVIRAA